MILVAIDPGLQGAFALYDTQRVSMHIVDMPTAAVGRSAKKDKTIVDFAATNALLAAYRDIGATHLVIEEVGGRPGQGASAAFSFGFGAGGLHSAAQMLGYSIEPVTPVKWKGDMRCPSDSSKAIRARATQLMPAHAHLWPLAKHDGRAEAAMLALWGERKLEGLWR